MSVNPLWTSPPQFVDSNGDPYSGALLFFYVAGSSTKQNVYTDSGGGTPCDNPITLNSSGYPSVSGTIVTPFGTNGVKYKIGLAAPGSSDPPNSFIWTDDQISPINDTTVTIDQWVIGPAPTYVSATSFTLVGDQTSTFTAGRRVKTTNSGGTVYSTIVSAVYGALTTVTVVNDSGTLDSGLSAVSYGLLSASNLSVPPMGQIVALTGTAGTNTVTASALYEAASYRTGQFFAFIPANTNTGATTLNVNSLGAKNVFSNGAACVSGELVAGLPVVVEYDGTQFQIIGQSSAQGSWTPSLGGSATYTQQVGFWRRSGNTVFVWGTITVNAIGTGSTGVISGLPVAAGASVGVNSGSVSFFDSPATNPIYVSAYVGSAGNTVTITWLASAASTPNNGTGFFANGTRCDFSVAYIV